MELIKIELENFRQFYGKQEIIFATGRKNVTIIFGENGKGKTGIFRALMFALYGDKHLTQDNSKDTIHLTNWVALESNKPVTAKVTVTFKNQGKTYIIERTVQGCKYNGETIESENGSKLYYTTETGDMSAEPITDYSEIRRIIDTILDRDVKEFFIFDAEKIDTLAKTTNDVKKEVKTAIVKLLQIDKLEKGIKITTDLYNKENRKIRNKSSNIDIINKANEKEALQEEIRQVEEKIQIKKTNIVDCNTEIETIKEKLDENAPIRELHRKIESIMLERRLKNDTLRTAKEGLKQIYFNEGHKLLMKDIYQKTSIYLKQILIDQKDLIGIEVIEKSLSEMKCACCKTDLKDVRIALENVKRLRDDYKRSELTPLISNITSNIYEAELTRDEKIKGIATSLKKIKELKDEIYSLDKRKENFQDQATEFSQKEENLKSLEASLKIKVKELDNMKDEVNRLEGQLLEKNKKLSELERQYQELLRQDKETKKDAKNLNYIQMLNEHLKHVFTEYTDEMREKLMEKTTKIFKELIDNKDKDLINRIVINDKYELEIYNWQDIKTTQDISQGQRQIVALAFITALAKIAGENTKTIDFPLFMDTPFGRISGNNRDNLIDNIPGLISQWVLLLTDTEFSTQEEIRFKASGKIGNWYKLVQIKRGHSQIQAINLDDNMATRR